MGIWQAQYRIYNGEILNMFSSVLKVELNLSFSAQNVKLLLLLTLVWYLIGTTRVSSP